MLLGGLKRGLPSLAVNIKEKKWMNGKAECQKGDVPHLQMATAVQNCGLTVAKCVWIFLEKL